MAIYVPTEVVYIGLNNITKIVSREYNEPMIQMRRVVIIILSIKSRTNIHQSDYWESARVFNFLGLGR